MTILTLILMASVTYFTRVIGFLAVQRMHLSKRAMSILEAAPGCVLISVIAPRFVSDSPVDLAALAITLVAASRYSLLTTVLVAIIVTGGLRAVFS